jgi:predicted ArsR family transcriptional regulator
VTGTEWQPNLPWDDDRDPTVRYHGGNRESVEAHDSVRHSKAAQRRRVLEFIAARDRFGATSDEIEEATGISHQACSARMTELKQEQMIAAVGRRKTRSGRAAMAWKLRQ